MSKKSKTKSLPGSEISRELDKIKRGKDDVEKIERGNRPREEKILEQLQRARLKQVERKILKDQVYDKHKKADKKIGGVRGKFHPSLERTRKKT